MIDDAETGSAKTLKPDPGDFGQLAFGIENEVDIVFPQRQFRSTQIEGDQDDLLCQAGGSQGDQ